MLIFWKMLCLFFFSIIRYDTYCAKCQRIRSLTRRKGSDPFYVSCRPQPFEHLHSHFLRAPHGLSYGIAYHSADGKQIVLEDISCNQEFVIKMAELFTLCQLPPDQV